MLNHSAEAWLAKPDFTQPDEVSFATRVDLYGMLRPDPVACVARLPAPNLLYKNDKGEVPFSNANARSTILLAGFPCIAQDILS